MTVGHIPSPGDPDAALAAVVALRRLADRLEAAAVDEALDAGWTWAQIAEALDISKQRRPQAPCRPPQRKQPTRRSAMRFRNAARDVRTISQLLTKAEAEARKDGQDAAGAEHLLLSAFRPSRRDGQTRLRTRRLSASSY